MRFEKTFTPYPHFIVCDLSSHIPVSVAIHDTLSKEPEYLVDEKPECLIERFIEVLTEKQEAIAANVLKEYPYPSDF